jgi:hypothetical protein
MVRKWQRLIKLAFLGIFFGGVFWIVPGVYGQNKSFLNVGAGGGLSYGGFGTRLTFTPFRTVGLFGALGYNLDAAGYNLGVQVHLPSPKKIGVYATGMYGYNTVLIVEAPAIKTRTTYYGFSAGLGLKFTLNQKTFLSSEILLPFRPEAYHSAIDDLESIGYDIRDAWPLAFCIGYHILL